MVQGALVVWGGGLLMAGGGVDGGVEGGGVFGG
jgi:hypothetical protein